VMSVSLIRRKDGSLALYYLLKNSAFDCRPVFRVSRDEARTWSASQPCIPDAEKGYYVLNNGRVERLKSGRLLLPLCLHKQTAEARTDPNGQLVCWFSDDDGASWCRRSEPFPAYDASGNRVVLQEPGVIELRDGRVLMYARTGHGRQWFFYSADGGETWSKGRPGGLIGPLSPATLMRLANGDILAIWNDHASRAEFAARDGQWGLRVPMTTAISKDEGLTWRHRKVLGEDRNGFYCYFAALELDDRVLLGYCAKDNLQCTRITTVPTGWLYEGGQPAPTGGAFAGAKEGPFWALSTVEGTWSAKPGEAEVRTWWRGKGVYLTGGREHRACLELPVGAWPDDLRLYVEREDGGEVFDFAVEGRQSDGTWSRMFALGPESKPHRVYPLRLTTSSGEVVALRFTCTSDKGAYIGD